MQVNSWNSYKLPDYYASLDLVENTYIVPRFDQSGYLASNVCLIVCAHNVRMVYNEDLVRAVPYFISRPLKMPEKISNILVSLVMRNTTYKNSQ